MKKLLKNHQIILKTTILIVIFITIAIGGFYYYKKTTNQILLMQSNKIKLDLALKTALIDLKNLKSQDQYKINKDLESKIKNIETTYTKAVSAYEKLLDLKIVTKKTEKFDSTFANILTLLSKRNYASAEAYLTKRLLSSGGQFHLPQEDAQSAV